MRAENDLHEIQVQNTAQSTIDLGGTGSLRARPLALNIVQLNNGQATTSKFKSILQTSTSTVDQKVCKLQRGGIDCNYQTKSTH